MDEAGTVETAVLTAGKEVSGVRPNPGFAVTATGLVAGLLALAGCGQQPAGGLPQDLGPAKHSVEPEARADARHQDEATARWANGYCAAVSALVESVSEMPSVDPSTPQRASTTSSQLLGEILGGLDRTLTNLAGLEPSPTPDAEAVRVRAVADYGRIRDRVAGAKQRIDTAVRDDARTAAIGEARRPLAEIGRINLLAGFEQSPELARASNQAVTCRRLAQQGPAPSLGKEPGHG